MRKRSAVGQTSLRGVCNLTKVLRNGRGRRRRAGKWGYSLLPITLPKERKREEERERERARARARGNESERERANGSEREREGAGGRRERRGNGEGKGEERIRNKTAKTLSNTSEALKFDFLPAFVVRLSVAVSKQGLDTPSQSVWGSLKLLAMFRMSFASKAQGKASKSEPLHIEP